MQSYEKCIREVLSDVVIEGMIPEDVLFTIDSRTIKPHEIFVALKGVHHDGHSFIQEAFARGAAGVMIARDKRATSLANISQEVLRNKVIISVTDPLQALIAFAARWREQFTYPIIGVTGSVGKTSTKETIAKMFSIAGYSYVASYGNQNTQIGLSLNMLRMKTNHQVAIFELGVSRRGEMAQLARMAKPTIGVITAIGHCHMEGLGSLHDIAMEKRQIFKYFTEHNIGIVDGDQPLLAGISYPHPIIKVGYKTTNHIQARKVRFVDMNTQCRMKIYKDTYDVLLSNPHRGTVCRALLTAAVGHVLHIPREHILAAIQEPLSVAGRFERRVLSIGQGEVIDDSYNANPESMKAALGAFQIIQTTFCKVAVLGDMLELGITSPFWHRQVGRFLRKIPSLQKLILVGNMVRCIEEMVPSDVETIRVATWQEAVAKLPEFLGNSQVMMLVKGSHGVGLSNFIAYCTK